VHHHATHALDPEAIAQVAEKQRLVGHLLDDAGFARRHLADDGGEDRRALVSDGGHAHRHIVCFESDVAVALAERRFGLELFGVDQPLDHDFGRRRHVEVDRRGFRDLDRRAGERAGNAEFVHIDGEFLRAGEHDHRRTADHDRDRHGFAALAIFEPMQIAAGAARLARHHAHHQPIGGLERGTVGAHVLDAAVGIPRHAQRRSQIGRGVEARSRYRHRKPRQPARRIEIIARQHDLLAARGAHRDRRDRVGDRTHPGLADVLDLLPHAHGVDIGRGRERADHDRNIVAPALRIGHVREQERAPLVLRHAAKKLPAHQRMQLGVFVDGTVDANEQAVRLEIGQMILEIKPRAIPQSGAMRSGGLIEHSGSTGIGPRATYHDPNAISYSICAARCITLSASPTSFLNPRAAAAPWSPRRCKRSTSTLTS
jgi:hypothetical protein